MKRVTLDTNTIGAEKQERIRTAITGRDIEVATTTVTQRELNAGGPPLPNDVPVIVVELCAWGESPWGTSRWPGPEDAELVNKILAIITNRSYPSSTPDTQLSRGHLRKLRDALILEAHTYAGRDVLITGDGDLSGPRNRDRLEQLCGTKIMTVDEFCSLMESGTNNS
jgi:hypothetical protein